MSDNCINIYESMDNISRDAEKRRLADEYTAIKSRGLKLTMTRGVPCPEQLALSELMLSLDLAASGGYTARDIGDVRNYGGPIGIYEMRGIFAEILNAEVNQIICGGASSLQLMYDTIARSLIFGCGENMEPWHGKKVKFLCPAPGYDRHFAICESFGIEMITIPMTPAGPDMDEVERYVNSDEAVKGIWCVPKYSNPQGVTYSAETVKRLAGLRPAARDFRIFWDNAYVVHDLNYMGDTLQDLCAELINASNPDMFYEFASTSKITFPGSGVACMRSSVKNIRFAESKIKFQTIGPDKINQLRHARFLKDASSVKAHMSRHAEIIRPKFEAVRNRLNAHFGDTGLAKWTNPNGGYFISLDVPDGCAKRTYTLAAELGVSLTPAGATYPLGKDPRDRNIRLSPTFPSVPELTQAIDAVAVCVKLAAIEAVQ
ncbi:aminotransferase [Clostridia bacterium]|nr:aminotransferase [Clostridia bacterium]